MDTLETLLLVAAGAALVYSLQKKDTAQDTSLPATGTAWNSTEGSLLKPSVPVAQAVVSVHSENPVTKTQSVTLAASPSQGVAAINQAVNTNHILQPTGQTLGVQVTPTASYGVEMLSGKKVAVMVQPAARNATGLTATDMLILSNKGLAPTVENARSLGLL